MLMPPQQKPTLPSGPGGSLDPDYKFIFEEPKKSRWRFSLFSSSGSMGRIALIIGACAIVLMILIIVFSSVFLKSHNVNSKQLIDVMARAQEISRVSTVVTGTQSSNVDANTLNLAATTISSLSSQKQQLGAYLGASHVKVKLKDLKVYQNQATDTQLQTAAETNTLNTAFNAYLKSQLTLYDNALKTAYPSSSPKVQEILNTADDSTKTILASPTLASAAPQ
jgi:hypothetical protein